MNNVDPYSGVFKLNPPYSPRYFSEGEFNTCTPSCCMSDVSDMVLRALDSLREHCGFPIRITCAFRSRQWDIAKGRSGDSMHCLGRAVDIAYKDSYQLGIILHWAPIVGFNGIGIAKTFVHLDNRPTPCAWLYD